MERKRLTGIAIPHGVLVNNADVVFAIEGSASMQYGFEDMKKRLLSIPDAMEENMTS